MLIEILEYIKDNPNCKLEEIASGLNTSKEKIVDDFSSLFRDKYIRKKHESTTNEFGGSITYEIFAINARGLEFLSKMSSTSISKSNTSKTKKKIFVSHAYIDRRIAERIIEKLLIPVFQLDKKTDIFFTSKRETGIKSSSNWPNKIKTSILEADIFIALITANFKKNEMCQNELGAAWIENKKIYPLILSPITFKNFGVVIANIQAENLRIKEHVQSFLESLGSDLKELYGINSDLENIDDGINKFLESLRSYLRRNPNLFVKATETKESHEKKPNKAIKKQPAEVIYKNIRKRSKIEWPDDYSMQVHYIEEQNKAFIEFEKLTKQHLNDSTISKIIKNARKEWPDDYDMQLHTAMEQIDSYERLQNNT